MIDAGSVINELMNVETTMVVVVVDGVIMG
jgi:hypothetical protein